MSSLPRLNWHPLPPPFDPRSNGGTAIKSCRKRNNAACRTRASWIDAVSAVRIIVGDEPAAVAVVIPQRPAS